MAALGQIKENNMNNSDINLHHANSSLHRLKGLHASFIQEINKTQAGQGETFLVEASIEAIVVKVFDYEFRAIPRLVLTVNEDALSFFVEHVFEYISQKDPVEVARFYLASDGVVVNSTDANEKIFEFNNMYVNKEIGQFVSQSALMSEVFQPAR